MDIVLFSQPLVSVLCICMMIGALVIAYAKKVMITYALIIANIAVFIITLIYQNEILGGNGYIGLGFRPIYLTPEYFPQIYTLFTSMFVHGGFLHIFGNMLVFFFIGMAFEERIGSKKFLIIYLVTGICGAITYSLLNLSYPNNGIALIGASGAIFGIMGAFAYSYPRDEVVMPIPIGIMFIMRVKVIYAVILFAVMETIFVALEVQDTVAHFAHIGGLISGIILGALMIKNKKVDGTASFQTTYHDSNAPQKPSKIDFAELNKLATTHELKEMLKRIENETLPQVRDIWLDHFLEKTVCPKCGNKLNHFDDEIWCEKCGFKTKY